MRARAWCVVAASAALALAPALACSSGGGGGNATNDGSPNSGDAGLIDDAIGQLDGAPSTALPPLPPLTNVVAVEREDSVGIDFDPVDDAVDYRVYPLPKDGDVTVNADGSVTVKNAIYRCAGLRQAIDLPNNTTNDVNNPSNGQQYYNGIYSWGAEIPKEPTLGYVYVEAGADRQPVYALAGYTLMNEVGWRESRLKVYTADAAERQKLLDQGWRDDGIAFYAPTTKSGTATIYGSRTSEVVAGQGWTQYAQYYFGEADKADHAKDDTPPAAAFQVLTAAADGTKPLMAVLYKAPEIHTELAVGKERFARASNQGPGPLWHLEWSGVTEPTVLVVEALATGCPYQGLLSPQALSAPPHQPFYTLDQLQKKSATGEVFVNGQFDLPGTVTDGYPGLQTPTASPKAIARSFVQVAPKPHVASDWDWYQGFSDASALSGLKLADIGPNCFECERGQSSVFDVSAISLDAPNNVYTIALGQAFGQLWTVFDDTGQDVTGKLRFTALQKSNVDADASKFLHVTWSVNAVGTDRRYPQLLISDQSAPVQDGLANPNNNTLLVQTIQGPAMRFELQAIHGLVNGKAWDVNNQAPEHRFIDPDTSDASDVVISGQESPFEHVGMDRMTKWDVFVSSDRIYAFMDGAPAGCSKYPSGFALQGAVTVTFGDVLYHEGAEDELVCSQVHPYAFMHEHQCQETIRHWDDLAFKAGVAAPGWDETKFPCKDY